MGAIAERLGVGAVHLARAFRQHRGDSVGDCVRGLQVNADYSFWTESLEVLV